MDNFKCYKHKENNAVCSCVGCGRFLCSDCTINVKGKNYCNECLNEKFDNLENKQTNVFMNSSSSASAAASSGNTRVPPYPTHNIIIHGLLLMFTLGLGNIIYLAYIINEQNKWKMKYRG